MRASIVFFFHIKIVDNAEYKFKLALLKGRVNDILKIIQTSRLVGETIIGYLQRKASSLWTTKKRALR